MTTTMDSRCGVYEPVAATRGYLTIGGRALGTRILQPLTDCGAPC